MRVGFRNWELGCGIWDFDSVLDWVGLIWQFRRRGQLGRKSEVLTLFLRYHHHRRHRHWCLRPSNPNANLHQYTIASLNERLSITYGYGGTSGDCRGQVFRVVGATPFWQTLAQTKDVVWDDPFMAFQLIRFSQRQEEVGGQFYFE
ncbi:hypothetical protein D9758_016660 [Tetrapyrgos nigripes]|uniref:Uncharacterized protein n=1 Tax=Tetrapyrgos nigripes TaxID=182062 RepID=A0A8H5FLS4_9AGAR|nr:hypothetical protein D9758_016660 [Tetrapyrgos nigripes]